MNERPAPQASSPPFARSEFVRRLLAAIVLAIVAFFAAFLGGAPATICAMIFSVIIAIEWLMVTGRARMEALPVATVALTIVAVILAGAGWPVLGAVLAVGGGIAIAAIARDGWLGAGLPYAAALGVGLLAVRADPEYGWPALVFIFAAVWGTDTAAYFAGRLIGGPKLWPAVSPKKTWSGAIGGLAGAIAAGSIAAAILSGLPLTPMLLVIAAVLSVLTQLGDLFESAVKRRFGVKDASQIIPGHGGVMDRVDGLIFAVVVAALIGWSHASLGHIGRGLLLW